MSDKRAQVYFFLAVFLASLVLSFFVFRPYLDLVVFSGILALLAWPAHRLVLKFFHGHKVLAALTTVALTLILVLLPLAFFVAALAVEAVNLFHSVQSNLQFSDVEGTLAKILLPEQAHAVASAIGGALANLVGYVQPLFAGLTSDIFAIFSNAAALIFGIFLVTLGMYYLLKDGPAFIREVFDLSPLSDEENTTIFSRVRDAIRGVAYGTFVMMLGKGLTGGLMFLVLGLPTPVFWGAMMGLASIVPLVGSGLVTVPFAVYLFITGHFTKGLILVLISLLVIGVVDNLLGPQLMRRRFDIHPFIILLAVLGGLRLFGALGVFFGPICLAVTLALIDIYKKKYRDEFQRIG